MKLQKKHPDGFHSQGRQMNKHQEKKETTKRWNISLEKNLDNILKFDK